MEVNFLVQGSSAEPYEVTFLHSDSGLAVFCTCVAGEHGQHCKHRLAILAGDLSAVVSNNKHEIATVQSWFAGTSLESAFRELKEAELNYGKAQKELAAAKRKISKVMQG